jgi:hypothetical protein
MKAAYDGEVGDKSMYVSGDPLNGSAAFEFTSSINGSSDRLTNVKERLDADKPKPRTIGEPYYMSTEIAVVVPIAAPVVAAVGVEAAPAAATAYWWSWVKIVEWAPTAGPVIAGAVSGEADPNAGTLPSSKVSDLEKLVEWKWARRAEQSIGIVIGKKPDLDKAVIKQGESRLGSAGYTWDMNIAWLRAAIDAKRPIRVVTPFKDKSELSGYYRKEIELLEKEGYKLRQVGSDWYMVKD